MLVFQNNTVTDYSQIMFLDASNPNDLMAMEFMGKSWAKAVIIGQYRTQAHCHDILTEEDPKKVGNLKETFNVMMQELKINGYITIP